VQCDPLHPNHRAASPKITPSSCLPTEVSVFLTQAGAPRSATPKLHYSEGGNNLLPSPCEANRVHRRIPDTCNLCHLSGAKDLLFTMRNSNHSRRKSQQARHYAFRQGTASACQKNGAKRPPLAAHFPRAFLGSDFELSCHPEAKRGTCFHCLAQHSAGAGITPVVRARLQPCQKKRREAPSVSRERSHTRTSSRRSPAPHS
jgi:hypothetical protein